MDALAKRCDPAHETSMFAIFESILPIFILISAGQILRRLPLIRDEGWQGLDQLGFWFLYPALLFSSIFKADFSGLSIGPMLFALMGSVFLFGALMLAAWPLMRSAGLVRHDQFSTVYQTTVRWNGFMALAIAQKLFAPEGAAVVALSMAAIVIPMNIASVYVVTRFADARADWSVILKRMATNPLILAALAGLAARLLPSGLYGPLSVSLDLIARAALGMGLVAIGAGLRPGDMASRDAALWLPVVLKLLVFPALLVAAALAFGVEGEGVLYLALCGAVPTAMNGYLLARQMGGDAPLYAATMTIQTIASFVTIPLVLLIARQVASG